MVITRVTPTELLRSVGNSLGLDPVHSRIESDAFVAALLRRVAGALCPCSPSTLAFAVSESLQHLPPPGVLPRKLDSVIERLIVVGDLLELSQVTIDNSDVKGTWVFVAPPSFVARPNGSVIITGISADETTPLPASLSARVRHEGVTRMLHPTPSENLPSILRDLGFVELSAKHWLRAPAPTSPLSMRDGMLNRLGAQLPSGAIAELAILDPATSVTHYRGRWIDPTGQTGDFVARRPQAYGAPLWGIVHVAEGVATQFLDFPLKETPFRGCDVAWHLQMAIDATRGTPQRYRIRSTVEGTCLDFFSPVPLWADRRLSILGTACSPEACLSSYLLPSSELATEEAFLRDRLWLARDNSQ